MEGLDPAALAAALEASPFGAWARGSSYAYPAANLVHLLGLVMLIGGIGVLDLRLLGLFRPLPAGTLARALVPLAATGVLLLVPSGFTMFAADAGPLFRSDLLRWKLALIAVGVVNLVIVHRTWRGFAGWDAGPPAAARVTAAVSLGVWLAAATLGRLIAYA